MDTIKLMTFIDRATGQAKALDDFVEDQRAVAGAVRGRDWPTLQKALERAVASAELVAMREAARHDAWSAFLDDIGEAPDATVFRASLALPLEYRSVLNDTYRALRLSALRARVENDALSGFVGEASSTLRQAIETLFPDRKGRMYGRSGKPQSVRSGALILDTAL